MVIFLTDACDRISSDTITVTKPHLYFSAGRGQSICLCDSAVLSATKGFFIYQWYPDSSLTAKNENSIIVFPVTTTTYQVSAEKFPGCKVWDSVKVIVDDCPTEIYFPNAFSPNGDGLNDHFAPVIIGTVSHYTFKVYNRYGQVVFQTNDPQKAWNGKINHEPAPLDIYAWTCTYAFRHQSAKNIKGTISLVR